MKKLRVPQLSCVTRNTALQEVSALLDMENCHAIERMPWNNVFYKPQVSFSIAYTGDAILLKYFVQENSIRVIHYTDNCPVHEDSCVEFFIAFDDEKEYYNLEFNCIGTCLFAYGDRSERQLIQEDLVQKIRRQGIIKSSTEGETNSINWELTLVIPLEVFVHHKITHLKDRHCKVNFYKCGDKLPEPHFLAWKNVEAASPDFHLPEFFGALHFI